MNDPSTASNPNRSDTGTPLWLLPLKIVVWPFVLVWKLLYEHWISYLIGRVLRDERRVYSVRFIWYGDSVYLHPLIWGSLILFFVTTSEVFTAGWPLLTWFILLAICFLTVMYNFDIIKASVLVISVVAVFSLAYVSQSKWEWNPLTAIDQYVAWMKPSVEPGFYLAASSVFAVLIAGEVFWAWLFNRVEIDESYVYEHRFLQSVSREPIFARGLKRETKDLLELLLLGAADIKHKTRNGYKTFKNVPAASLGLGAALDKLLDHRRPGQIDLELKKKGKPPRAGSTGPDQDMLDQAAGNMDVDDG